VYIDDGGKWKVDVPVFWEAVSVAPGRMAFQDPLGARLRLERVDGPPRAIVADPNEVIVTQGPQRAGKHMYLAVSAIATVDQQRLARFLFQRTVGPYTYILFFECDAEDASLYRGLLDRILAGFEVSD